MSDKHPHAASHSPSQSPKNGDPTPKQEESRIWQLLNSNFGIFVCSSIVLASFSFGYHQWVKHESDQRKIEQLDIEIGARLRDMKDLAQLADRDRYNNIENIQRIDEGKTQELRDKEVRNLFWIRKPAFNEYKDRNLTSLMWQLYLLVPSSEQPGVRRAIQDSIQMDRLIAEIRFKATSGPELPPAKTKEEQDRQDEEENKLKKDFGQSELFRLIQGLAEVSRWKSIATEAGS